MTKAELIAVVGEKAGLTKKDADKAVTAVLEAITETLVNGEKVSLVGFGTFEVKERAERMRRSVSLRRFADQLLYWKRRAETFFEVLQRG